MSVTVAWMRAAACNDANRPDNLTPEDWYPDQLAKLSDANLDAILVCRTACPVTNDCARAVLTLPSYKRWGIWAGVVHDQALMGGKPQRRLDERAHTAGRPESDDGEQAA